MSKFTLLTGDSASYETEVFLKGLMRPFSCKGGKIETDDDVLADHLTRYCSMKDANAVDVTAPVADPDLEASILAEAAKAEAEKKAAAEREAAILAEAAAKAEADKVAAEEQAAKDKEAADALKAAESETAAPTGDAPAPGSTEGQTAPE